MSKSARLDRRQGERQDTDMQYLLMILSDAERWAAMPQADIDSMMKDWVPFMDSIVKAGHVRGGARLHPPATATTVRMTGGKANQTDGPFAESKEQLGGYLLLECENLDLALSIAKRVPTLRAGDVVEVRPVMSTPQT